MCVCEREREREDSVCERGSDRVPRHHLPVCRVQGSGCRVQGSGFRVQGAGFRVQGAGCRIQGAGCRVDTCQVFMIHEHDSK